MTLEIAQALPGMPQIAAYGLLIQGSIHGPEWLRRLEATPSADQPLAGLPQSGALQRFKRALGDTVPGVTHLHLARRRWSMRRALKATAQKIIQASPLPMVYHEPNMITRPYDGPIVPTLNDLSWHHDPDLHPRERIQWIERNLSRTLDTATRFIAISAFTRNEAARVLGLDPARIDVAHLAPSPAFVPLDAAQAATVLHDYELNDQSYILSISTLEPRKNFDRLLNAYLGLPPALRARVPLVIAGGKGWGNVLFRPDAQAALDNGQLRLLGHVPDAALVALTARCACFAYVSLYEGFGLPVIEAMATGVPVIASATTATGETAGEAAMLVDPLDESAIRQALAQMLDSPQERLPWAGRSAARAALFTWRATADTMAHTWALAATNAG